MNKILILAILLFYINVISAGKCNNFKTCGECMGSPHLCVWCSDPTHEGPRCTQKAGLLKCQNAVNFESSSIKNVANKIGHLMPQRMKAVIQNGEKLKFSFTYKPAKDHALDVYFLIDCSHTMKRHIDKIQTQAAQIKAMLTKTTNNVRFGMGTFVEKFALPYGLSSTTEDHLFYNHFSLSDDVNTFRQAVNHIKNIGNLDIPEAGLDALMQVMICKEIGWRLDARQIIIFATDSTYHSAGDGKMVGTFKPNDAKCHMKNNAYNREDYLTYDYPSVSQINKVANQKGINILFAVIDKAIPVYKALSKQIKRSEVVELSLKSNLADMLIDQYTKLQQKMQLDYSTSLSKDSYRLYFDKGYDKPHSFDVKQIVTINAEFELTKCPNEGKYNLTIDSKDLHDEELLIDIEINCKCPCERRDQAEINSAKCNGGSFKCGICTCEKGRYGERCECAGSHTTETAMVLCKTKSNDTALCSGRGECVCGECKNCRDNYVGNHCEYSLRDCPYYHEEPCGGNGKCENKVCKCYGGWKGKDCSCPLDTGSCVGPNSKICSGNGHCECGECQCTKKDENGDIYKGKYCNYCDKCNLHRCQELENYVVCYYNKINETKLHEKSIEYCDRHFKHLTQYDVRSLRKAELNSSTWNDTYWCKKSLNDNTFVVFKYKDDIGNTLILIQKEKEPAPTVNYWWPIAISIGSVILIGILTALVWKVLVDIHDAREYSKFAKESSKQGYDVTMNPLYLSPAISIANPAYCNNID